MRTAQRPHAGDHPKRSALFNSGAEAVENAIKIARHVTGRQAVVVFDHGYHGRTNPTLALTAKNMPYKHRFGPFVPEVYRVPTSYPFRDPAGMTGERAAARALHAGGLSGTYGGNPVACAAALASINMMRELDLAGVARRIGAATLERLRRVRHPEPLPLPRGEGCSRRLDRGRAQCRKARMALDQELG